MLVLERKAGKSVIIGTGDDEVVVTVLDANTDPVTGQVVVKLWIETLILMSVDDIDCQNLLVKKKHGQSLKLNNGQDQVMITILDTINDNTTDQNSVKLGFDADRHICIDREEVRPKRNQRIQDAMNGTNSQ